MPSPNTQIIRSVLLLGIALTGCHSLLFGQTAVSIQPASVLPGVAKEPYSESFTLTPSGGSYTWEFLGSPPPGLSFSNTNSSAKLNGAPVQSGQFTFTIRVTQKCGLATGCPSGSQTYQFTINPALAFSTQSFPVAVTNQTYKADLLLTGGLSPITVAVTRGALPPGLNLAGGGISGTPNTPGNYAFTLTATGTANSASGGGSVSRDYTLLVRPPLSFTTTSPLPSALVGTAYSVQFAATGGIPPYSFGGSGNRFPPGLSLTSDGRLSGTPTSAGTFNIPVQLTDSANSTITQTFQVTVDAPALPDLKVQPGSLSFTITQGSNAPPVQTLSVTSTGSAFAYTVSAASTPSGWLAASGAGNTPGQVSVGVNPQGLTAGSYTGTVTIVGTNPGGTRTVVVPVNLTVSPAPVQPSLTVSPSSLNFAPAANGGPAASQAISVGSSGAALTFTTSVATTSGGNWLSVAPGSGQTPATLNVTANPAQLAPGTYNGSVTITSTGAGNGPQVVGVTLTIPPASTQPSLTVNPPSLNFAAAASGASSASQVISLGSTGASLTFTTSVATTTGGNWLSAAPASGQTPASLNVTANPAQLAPGTYTGTVTITSAGAGNSPQVVPVSLTVGPALAQPSLTVNPPSLNFAPAATGGSGTSQTISVSSSGAPLTFNTNVITIGGNWLSVTPSNAQTPANLNVTVNPGVLPPGTYAGSITITSAGASNNPQVVPVTLVVPTAGSASFSVTPAGLNFSAQPGGPVPSAQTLAVSAGTAVGYTATALTDGGGSWLSVTPVQGTTPGTLSVSVNPANLTPGNYLGAIRVIPNNSALQPQNIPVRLAVGIAPGLVAAPRLLSFSYQLGDASPPAGQSLSVFANGGSVPYTATVSGAPWLTLGSASGQTPGTIPVTVNPTGLSPDRYNGVINISAPGATPSSLAVPVTLVVTGAQLPALTVEPNFVNVAVVQNSAAVQRQLRIVNSGGGNADFAVEAQTQSGGNWLSTASNNGSATPASPGIVALRIDPSGLRPGTYLGGLLIRSRVLPNPIPVPVVLVVNRAQQAMALSPFALEFTSTAPGVAVPSQTVSVVNVGQGSMDWTATVNTLTSGSNWLQVTPASGTSNANDAVPPQMTLSVNTTGLAAGRYFATVRVNSPTANNAPQSVYVALTVLAQNQSQTPTISPFGVILVGPQGGSTSTVDTVQLRNLTDSDLTYTISVSTEDTQNWLTATPASGTVASGKPVTLSLQASLTGLTAGVHKGTARVAFSDGTVRTVSVLLIVTEGTVGTAQAKGARTAACEPKLIVTQLLSIEQGFTVTAQQAADIRMRAVDDCGSPMTTGASQATFSNGDRNLTLLHTGNGNWSTSWQPSAAGQQVKISITALRLEGLKLVSGQVDVVGTIVAPNQTVGAVVRTVLNSASSQGEGQVAPGVGISVYGEQLATATQAPSTVPYPKQLGDLQVLLNNNPIPLQYVSAQQVNALVPNGTNPNTDQQLVVRRGDTLSVPVQVTVTEAQPAIYTTNQQGSGQGAILVSGTTLIAGPTAAGARPARRGEFLEIYCTGLGAVSNAPEDGGLAPSAEPLARTTATPTLTIGGVDAPIVYSGLAPGLVGVYQVNAKVPDNAPQGDAVPLILTLGTLQSNTATIAVQ